MHNFYYDVTEERTVFQNAGEHHIAIPKRDMVVCWRSNSQRLRGRLSTLAKVPDKAVLTQRSASGRTLWDHFRVLFKL